MKIMHHDTNQPIKVMPFSSGWKLRKRAQKDWFLLFSQHNTSLMFSFVGKEIMTEGKKEYLNEP